MGFVYLSKMIIFVKSIKEHHKITIETNKTEIGYFLGTKGPKCAQKDPKYDILDHFLPHFWLLWQVRMITKE